MKSFVYKKLNAFSNGSSTGNPATYLLLDKTQKLSEADMLAIAKEHKGFVSEVIYCTLQNNYSYRLRYYSSECEVEFCGHGTIACMYDLIKNDRTLKNRPVVSIQTNKGELYVYNEIDRFDAVFITAPDPLFLPVPTDPDNISPHLSIASAILDSKYPVDFIDAGLRTLIVPIGKLSDIIAINPDEARLKKFCIDNGIDIILVFTTDIANSNNKIRSRVFAPKFGYLEDPATGSGNSALGYYLLKNKLWNGESISIEQNNEINNFNVVKLKTKDNKVLFGGNAILKIEGNYYL